LSWFEEKEEISFTRFLYPWYFSEHNKLSEAEIGIMKETKQETEVILFQEEIHDIEKL
jgi:hypothetical protein